MAKFLQLLNSIILQSDLTPNPSPKGEGRSELFCLYFVIISYGLQSSTTFFNPQSKIRNSQFFLLRRTVIPVFRSDMQPRHPGGSIHPDSNLPILPVFVGIRRSVADDVLAFEFLCDLRADVL